MTDQNIDPIDALTDAGLRPIIIDEDTDFDALPKFNAFTIYDVLIHLRPDLAEASSISGGEFDKAGLPMFGGCYVCGAGIAAHNACPGKNGFLVGTCCATAHNTFATIEEFLASRETNDSTICPSCGDSEGGSSCCPDAMERYFEERLAQHQETIERQAKRIALLVADFDALALERDVLRRDLNDALARVPAPAPAPETETNPALTWTCDDCGSTKVQGTAWIHLNSNAIVQGDPPDDDAWCEDCEDHVTVSCGPRKPQDQTTAT